ncbi:MAG TPA: hypothetical protein VG929_02225 [Actinomycetota bacterium]|nr:hypothetical protein [Actinomycetota bacterium]
MAIRIGLGLGALLVLALFVGTRDLPSDEAGRPEITVAFPATAEPGSVETATFTITNPGPDIRTLFISFARVGPATGGGEIPVPIVDMGTRHENPAIVDVDPEPEATSIEGVVFAFGPLPTDGSMTVSFDLRMPADEGPAANSVTAYAGEEPERARGVRLETEVGG